MTGQQTINYYYETHRQHMTKLAKARQAEIVRKITRSLNNQNSQSASKHMGLPFSVSLKRANGTGVRFVQIYSNHSITLLVTLICIHLPGECVLRLPLVESTAIQELCQGIILRSYKTQKAGLPGLS